MLSAELLGSDLVYLRELISDQKMDTVKQEFMNSQIYEAFAYLHKAVLPAISR